MRTTSALTIILSLLIAVTSAAPTLLKHCEKVAGPGELSSRHVFSGGYIDNYHFHISNKHQENGHGLLTASKNETSQKFEFFSCEPPSDNFKQSTGTKGTEPHAYGVVRSAKNNDQCLTIVRDSQLVTKGDAVMALAPCSKTANGLEKQWFQIRGDVVDYVGKKGDTELQSTYELADGVVGIQATYTRGKGLNFGYMKLN
ncbi:hypothetical protein MPSI1_003553 [Malassezia psittaci]|uniref:Ricin B lectin domain-containing protein n=1 Tax=Malassezia psittaci TaxID=1821823 RepID=A0AAF0JM80_9BASI|nr:hypothetical protein MPSI1_003553 [Malassezia psittaci]